MKTELYYAIKKLNINMLEDLDKEDLLTIFMVTKNYLLRDQIAFIFSDINYEKAVPYIIKKINDKNTYNNNSSLVHSLEGFNLKRHFVSLIKIICEQDYEARLLAYSLVEELIPKASKQVRLNSLKRLKDCRNKLIRSKKHMGENSTLHFVEKATELLLRKF